MSETRSSSSAADGSLDMEQGKRSSSIEIPPAVAIECSMAQGDVGIDFVFDRLNIGEEEFDDFV
jgi:hypothetical protein